MEGGGQQPHRHKISTKVEHGPRLRPLGGGARLPVDAVGKRKGTTCRGIRENRSVEAPMTVTDAIATPSAVPPAPVSDDPEALMDQVWQLVERIRARATDRDRYHVELIQDGAEHGDLNLIEIGLHRFRDVAPLEDDDD